MMKHRSGVSDRMTTRRALLTTSAILLSFWSGTVFAAPPVPFDEGAFDKAQEQGQPILVVVSSPWCPICKAQKPILARLGADPKYRDLAIYEIDFDTQKSLVRRFEARMQSTLIAFKGRKEIGRSVGETQPEWIEVFLEGTQ